MDQKYRREKLKKFRVYYFVGDYFSSRGEEEKSTIILARSESEAEQIVKNNPPRKYDSFGWVEEV